MCRICSKFWDAQFVSFQTFLCNTRAGTRLAARPRPRRIFLRAPDSRRQRRPAAARAVNLWFLSGASYVRSASHAATRPVCYATPWHVLRSLFLWPFPLKMSWLSKSQKSKNLQNSRLFFGEWLTCHRYSIVQHAVQAWEGKRIGSVKIMRQWAGSLESLPQLEALRLPHARSHFVCLGDTVRYALFAREAHWAQALSLSKPGTCSDHTVATQKIEHTPSATFRTSASKYGTTPRGWAVIRADTPGSVSPDDAYTSKLSSCWAALCSMHVSLQTHSSKSSSSTEWSEIGRIFMPRAILRCILLRMMAMRASVGISRLKNRIVPVGGGKNRVFYIWNSKNKCNHALLFSYSGVGSPFVLEMSRLSKS